MTYVKNKGYYRNPAPLYQRQAGRMYNLKDPDDVKRMADSKPENVALRRKQDEANRKELILEMKKYCNKERKNLKAEFADLLNEAIEKDYNSAFDYKRTLEGSDAISLAPSENVADLPDIEASIQIHTLPVHHKICSKPIMPFMKAAKAGTLSLVEKSNAIVSMNISVPTGSDDVICSSASGPLQPGTFLIGAKHSVPEGITIEEGCTVEEFIAAINEKSNETNISAYLDDKGDGLKIYLKGSDAIICDTDDKVFASLNTEDLSMRSISDKVLAVEDELINITIPHDMTATEFVEFVNNNDSLHFTAALEEMVIDEAIMSRISITSKDAGPQLKISSDSQSNIFSGIFTDTATFNHVVDEGQTGLITFNDQKHAVHKKYVAFDEYGQFISTNDPMIEQKGSKLNLNAVTDSVENISIKTIQNEDTSEFMQKSFDIYNKCSLLHDQLAKVISTEHLHGSETIGYRLKMDKFWHDIKLALTPFIFGMNPQAQIDNQETTYNYIFGGEEKSCDIITRYHKPSTYSLFANNAQKQVNHRDALQRAIKSMQELTKAKDW